MANFHQHRRCPRPETVIIGSLLSSLLAMRCAAFVRPQASFLIRQLNDVGHNHGSHCNSKPIIALNENPNLVMEEGGMILASDKNLLNMAFSSLDDKDKYETVLTGLCAKVIDGGTSSVKEGLADPIRLIEEMNSSRIVAGPRSIISLVDVSAHDHTSFFALKFLMYVVCFNVIGNCNGLRCTYNGKYIITCNKKWRNNKLWHTSRHNQSNSTKNVKLLSVWWQ